MLAHLVTHARPTTSRIRAVPLADCASTGEAATCAAGPPPGASVLDAGSLAALAQDHPSTRLRQSCAAARALDERRWAEQVPGALGTAARPHTMAFDERCADPFSVEQAQQ